MKCPGVRASRPSPGATTRLRWNVKVLTAASQGPPKWGACSGMKSHWMLFVQQFTDYFLCYLMVEEFN